MRTPDEMLNRILEFAKQHNDIFIVGMEGSRVNKNIKPDSFQDFDITFFVNDLNLFTKDDSWLSYFGKIIMLQKPEDMELFPAVETGYSYLILFDDYNKLDLTLLEMGQLSDYLSQDKLRTIILDKTAICPVHIIPTDEEYWIKRPSARSFDDCCNEFWNITPYVVKGLCRKEIIYAIDHLHLMRSELLRMLSWEIGIETGFCFSVGKNYKFIDQYLTKEKWEKLLSTYREDSYEAMWNALFSCHDIFRQAAKKCGAALGYDYPSYDSHISQYTEYYFNLWGRDSYE